MSESATAGYRVLAGGRIIVFDENAVTIPLNEVIEVARRHFPENADVMVSVPSSSSNRGLMLSLSQEESSSVAQSSRIKINPR